MNESEERRRMDGRREVLVSDRLHCYMPAGDVGDLHFPTSAGAVKTVMTVWDRPERVLFTDRRVRAALRLLVRAAGVAPGRTVLYERKDEDSRVGAALEELGWASMCLAPGGRGGVSATLRGREFVHSAGVMLGPLAETMARQRAARRERHDARRAEFLAEMERLRTGVDSTG